VKQNKSKSTGAHVKTSVLVRPIIRGFMVLAHGWCFLTEDGMFGEEAVEHKDHVPAGQEDQNGSRDLQTLNVLDERLEERHVLDSNENDVQSRIQENLSITATW
jgi:hypothetical protein